MTERRTCPQANPNNRDNTNQFEFFHLSRLLTENLRAILPVSCNSAARRSWVLRGVVRGFTGGDEDPWFSVSVFRQVWLCRCYALSVVEDWLDHLTIIIGTYSSDSNVRCGSTTAFRLEDPIDRFEYGADVRLGLSTVRFRPGAAGR